MARADYTRVLVALLGNPPPGVTTAAITAVCVRVDNKINSITAPDTISTTGEMEKEIAVDMVLLEIEYALWLQAGGALSGKPKPVVLPKSIIDRIRNLSTSTADIGIADMMPE